MTSKSVRVIVSIFLLRVVLLLLLGIAGDNNLAKKLYTRSSSKPMRSLYFSTALTSAAAASFVPSPYFSEEVTRSPKPMRLRILLLSVLTSAYFSKVGACVCVCVCVCVCECTTKRASTTCLFANACVCS